MSKLLELIEAESTGKRHVNLEPLRNICEVYSEFINTKYAEEYRIKVILGANVVVNTPESLPYAVEQVKHSVNEAVFGEFRAPLREIQRLLWERKYEESSQKVAELEKQMFSL